jgi:hypothetical protein
VSRALVYVLDNVDVLQLVREQCHLRYALSLVRKLSHQCRNMASEAWCRLEVDTSKFDHLVYEVNVVLVVLLEARRCFRAEHSFAMN